MFVRCYCSNSRNCYSIEFRKNNLGIWCAGPTNMNSSRSYGTNVLLNPISFQYYTGCPYCNSNEVIKCNICGQLSCGSSSTDLLLIKYFRCKYCKNIGVVAGQFHSLTASNSYLSAKTK